MKTFLSNETAKGWVSAEGEKGLSPAGMEGRRAQKEMVENEVPIHILWLIQVYVPPHSLPKRSNLADRPGWRNLDNYLVQSKINLQVHSS